MFGTPSRRRNNNYKNNKVCSFSPSGVLVRSTPDCSPMRRNTLKEACNQSSLERRHQRRHEWSSQIRKVRKSHQIQLKRTNTVATTTSVSSSSSSSLMELCELYIQQSSSSSALVGTTLATFQSRLSKHVHNQQHQKEEEEKEEMTSFHTLQSDEDDVLETMLTRTVMNESSGGDVIAVCLLKALSKSLIQGQNVDEQMNAARCLTNLAASSHTNNNEEDNYYGHPVETWCTYMVQANVGVLSAWIHVVTSFLQIIQQMIQNQTMSVGLSQCMIDLTEQCCWALGNIAGDSSSARQVVLQPNHNCTAEDVPSLMISVLHWSHEFQSLNQQAARTATATGTDLVVVGLCRNAAWALSNLARGADTSASLFLQSTTTQLTPRLLAHLLTSPERFFKSNSPVSSSAAKEVTTWSDVSLETMWFTAFLTAREYEAVDYLCSADESSSSLLCEALAFRLGYVAHVLSLFSNFSAAGDKTIQAMDVALTMAVPSIRAVGNIATACHGRYVTKLLTSKAKVSSKDLERNHNQHVLHSSYGPITASLARIIQDASNPPSVKRRGNLMAVAAEAAWAAGTLLCDAGPPEHPSTTIAIPTLLLPLCQAITSDYAKLEFKREALQALFHTVSTPPIHNNNNNNNNNNNMMLSNDNNNDNNCNGCLPARDGFLQTIVSFEEDMIAALVDLLVCYDSDAVAASVQLINLIFRRLVTMDNNNIKQRFEEANIVNALETICDRASSSSPSLGQDHWNSNNPSERSADIAADLIDDFFADDDDIMGDDDYNNNNNNDMIVNVQPQTYQSVTGQGGEQQTRFAFGLGSNTLSSIHKNNNNGMNFDFSSPTVGTASVVTNESNDTPSRGRGRGRGHTMPAWMQTRTV